jgi:MATE family multidrug resistance protein
MHLCCSVAGRLGQFELSTIILGTSVFNVTGLSVLIGFSSAMETLSGCGCLPAALHDCL